MSFFSIELNLRVLLARKMNISFPNLHLPGSRRSQNSKSSYRRDLQMCAQTKSDYITFQNTNDPNQNFCPCYACFDEMDWKRVPERNEFQQKEILSESISGSDCKTRFSFENFFSREKRNGRRTQNSPLAFDFGR